ncbi:MAG: transposase [Rhodobacter sp.]|nr:transposase [Rhodobacter sp.]
MPNYRRAYVAGASYFFTVTLADRTSGLLVDRISELRRAYADTVRTMPMRCDAMVVLPDHMHAVWTLPAGDDAFSERWRKIKHRFSRAIGGAVGRTAHPTLRSASKVAKRECGIWQRRFWEHVIRDEADFRMHVAYCWGNPVKHGYVARAVDWPYSSIHRDIRLGRVGPEWAGEVPDGDFGE